MLSLEERADLLVRIAELHRKSAYAEITNLLRECSDEDLFSEPDLGYSLTLAYYRTDQFGAARNLNQCLIPRAKPDAVGSLYRKHLILKGILNVEEGKLYEAEGVFHEAMAYATRANDQWVIADVTMNLGILAWIACDWPKALLAFERALTAYTTLGRSYSVAACHQNLGMTYRELGMAADSDAHFQWAYQLFSASETDRSYELALVESERALLVCGLGDHDRAEAMARRALARASSLGAAKREGEALRALGVVLGNRGEFRKGIQSLEKALRLARKMGSRLLAAEVCDELCKIARLGGFSESANRYAAEAIRLYSAIGADARVQAVRERYVESKGPV